MFEALSEKITGVLNRLKRRGALTEADIQAAMREVRLALGRPRSARRTRCTTPGQVFSAPGSNCLATNQPG